jgi:hypothetical protein
MMFVLEEEEETTSHQRLSKVEQFHYDIYTWYTRSRW